MANTVKIRNSSTAAAAPSSLEAGELAINTADAKLFWEDSAGSIQTTYLLPAFDDLASTAHASTHATGGSDAIAPADIGAAPAASPVFSGNVGIGANPSLFSSSFNNLVVGNGSSVEGAMIYSTTQGTLAFGDTATTGVDGYRGYVAYVHTTDYMVLGTGGVERLRVNSAGITVSGVITVSAGSAASPAIVASGDSNTGIAFPAADTFSISTAGVERVRVGSDGKVGVNTTTLTHQLNVSGTSGFVGDIRINKNGSDSISSCLFIGNAGGTRSFNWQQNSDGFSLDFWAYDGSAWERRVRFKNTGAVRFIPLASDPSTGTQAGDVYYNSITNKLRVYNGTSWVDLH